MRPIIAFAVALTLATVAAAESASDLVMPLVLPVASSTPAVGVMGTAAAGDSLHIAANIARTSRGIKEAAVSPALATAAQSHANYLAAHGYGPGSRVSGHYFDGRNWQQRAAAAGYYGPCNEILAGGYRTPADAVAGWCQTDSGHYKVLLGGQYNAAGFGYAVGRNGPVYVGLFGQTPYQSPQVPTDVQEPPHDAITVDFPEDRHQHRQAPVQAPKAAQAPVYANCAGGSCGVSYGYRTTYRAPVRRFANGPFRRLRIFRR